MGLKRVALAGGLLVRLADQLEKRASQTADGSRVTLVGVSQPSCYHAAEMRRRIDEHGGAALPDCRDGRQNTARGAAVHEDIRIGCRGPKQEGTHDGDVRGHLNNQLVENGGFKM